MLEIKNIGKLAVFLFIIAGNYVGDIFSCNLRHLFNKYMFLKHMIGILIMLLFVGMLDTTSNMSKIVIDSILYYLLFILIMRTPSIITIIIIFLIIIIYLLSIYIDRLKVTNNEKTNEETDIKKNDINQLIIYIFYLIIILSISGFLFQMYTTYKILGNKFNFINFFSGSRDQECFTKEIFEIFEKYGLLSDVKSQLVKNKTKNNINFIPFKLKKRLQK